MLWSLFRLAWKLQPGLMHARGIFIRNIASNHENCCQVLNAEIQAVNLLSIVPNCYILIENIH